MTVAFGFAEDSIPARTARVEALLLGMEGRVLDVGAGARPFARADAVVDALPLAAAAVLGTWGSGSPRYREASWTVADLCGPEPLPFPDKHFDFAVCTHTLEDLRDPLFTCRELQRVARAGYIECPSHRSELARGVENRRYSGRAHHRWLVRVEGEEVRFLLKYHSIHTHWRYHIPAATARRRGWLREALWIAWSGSFCAREEILADWAAIDQALSRLVQEQDVYAAWRYRAFAARRRWRA